MRVQRMVAATALVLAVLVPAVPPPASAQPAPAAALPTCTDWSKFRVRSWHILVIPTTRYQSHDWSCQLQVGNRNPAVFVLQDAINRCNGGSLTVDGIYGTRTRDAVGWLQAAAGIEADGVYGPATALLAMYWPDQIYNGPCIRLRQGTPALIDRGEFVPVH